MSEPQIRMLLSFQTVRIYSVTSSHGLAILLAGIFAVLLFSLVGRLRQTQVASSPQPHPTS